MRFVWIELVTAWLIFRHLYKASASWITRVTPACRPCAHPRWCFVGLLCSEHVPDAPLAVACWPLLTPRGATRCVGPPSLSRLAAEFCWARFPLLNCGAAPIAAVAPNGGRLGFLRSSATLPNWRLRRRASGTCQRSRNDSADYYWRLSLAVGGIWSDFSAVAIS